jgi:glycosyltransferase involved in cell wall biosynthesis
MIRAVHQFLPVLSGHDAVGAHTLLVRDALRAAGFESEIYAEQIHDDVRTEAHDVGELDWLEPNHRLVYQLSTNTAHLDALKSIPTPLTINYHSSTPPEFFANWHTEAAVAMTAARSQATTLGPRASFTIATSQFTAAEFTSFGAKRVSVFPPLPQALDRPEPPIRPAAARAQLRLLFVGRIAPNKAQHVLVAAVAELERRGRSAHLTLVGTPSSSSYLDALQALAGTLGVADQVTFRQGLSSPELASMYADSSAFVCASRHEGFCVPLMEAMLAGLPIIAVRSTAVTETVGAEGTLVGSGDPGSLADAIEQFAAAGPPAGSLERGRVRATDYFAATLPARYCQVLLAGLGIAR